MTPAIRNSPTAPTHSAADPKPLLWAISHIMPTANTTTAHKTHGHILDLRRFSISCPQRVVSSWQILTPRVCKSTIHRARRAMADDSYHETVRYFSELLSSSGGGD